MPSALAGATGAWQHREAILIARGVYLFSVLNRYEKRIFQFPKAALNRNEDPKKIDKFGYYELLSSNMDPNCTRALIRMAPQIDLGRIAEIIDKTPLISDVRKEFYTTMICHRKERIIDASLKRLAQIGVDVQ